MNKLDLEQILCIAKSTGADFSELYLENRYDTIVKNHNRKIQSVNSLHIHGAGLYLLRGTESVYVYTNDTSVTSLLELAKTAASLLSFVGVNDRELNVENKNLGIIFSCQKNRILNPVEIFPKSVNVQRKVKVLNEMEQAVYAAGPSIQMMDLDYYDATQNVTIANSDGLYTEDTRVSSRIRLRGGVNWQDKTCFEFHDLVRPQGFEMFREVDYVNWGQRTVCQMEESLQVRPIAPCVVPVVFEAGDCGVFWHEVCGHNLEAGAATGGIFAGKIGEKIASSKITLVDDGSIMGMNGSEAIDDEGHRTQKNVLIENGVLQGFLCDRKGGRVLGTGSTGSGRRQSYTYAPCARMHNTYLAAGNDDEEEMITSMDKGILVTRLGGGSSGANFSLAVQDGFWIENGKIKDRIGKFTLSGSSAEILAQVDRVGRRLVPDMGGGYCGATSGLVPTTAYGPRFRVSAMNVGGNF